MHFPVVGRGRLETGGEGGCFRLWPGNLVSLSLTLFLSQQVTIMAYILIQKASTQFWSSFFCCWTTRGKFWSSFLMNNYYFYNAFFLMNGCCQVYIRSWWTTTAYELSVQGTVVSSRTKDLQPNIARVESVERNSYTLLPCRVGTFQLLSWCFEPRQPLGIISGLSGQKKAIADIKRTERQGVFQLLCLCVEPFPVAKRISNHVDHACSLGIGGI